MVFKVICFQHQFHLTTCAPEKFIVKIVIEFLFTIFKNQYNKNAFKKYITYLILNLKNLSKEKI